MNHEQLMLGLSTLIVIGIALFMYAVSKGGKSRLPVWVWPALIPYLAFAILSILLHGLAIVIGWSIRRLSGQEILSRKWPNTADQISSWGCLILIAVSMVGGLVWLVLQFIVGG
jgi:divalent metal cation (Fe/Co/Zn/Cd) transporter